MKEIYLNHVALQDFRTFGEFDITLPDRPGLTMLVGTNGLGKSSFFDALEWNLTGLVRRFQPYLDRKTPEEKYLTRREAPPGAHRVDLTFSGGRPLSRLGLFHLSESSVPLEAEEVTDLLKDPAWKVRIDDIGVYLALTHFLGQTSEQRFTSRNNEDQWAAIRGPSGIGRLEAIREALRGRATTLAFGRRQTAETDEVNSLKARIAEWQSFQDRLQRLEASSSAADLPMGDDLQARLDELAAQIFVDGARPARPSTIEAQLTLLRAAIQTLRAETSTRLTALRGLEDLCTRHPPLQANIVAQTKAQEVESDNLAKLRAAREQAQAAAEAERQKRDTKTKQVSDVAASVATLEAIRVDLEKKRSLDEALAVATTERNALQQQSQITQNEIREIDLAITEAKNALGELAQLEAVVGLAETYVAMGAETAEKQEQAAAQAAHARKLREDVAPDEIALPALTKRRDDTGAQIAVLTSALNPARARASEIGAATAALAAHIHNDDTTCPLCRSEFPRGVLLRVTQAAATAADSELAAMEAELARLNSELSETSVLLTAMEARLKAAREAADAAARLQREANELDRRTRALIGAADGDHLTSAAKAFFEQSARARDLALSRKPAIDQHLLNSEAARKGVQARLEQIGRELETAEQRIAAITREIRACIERINARNGAAETLDSVTTALESLRADRVSSEAELALLGASTIAALSRLKEAQDALQAATDKVARERATLVALQSEAQANINLWTSQGLEGEPLAATLRAATIERQQRLAACDSFETECEALARAAEAARQNLERRELLAAMTAAGGEVGASDPAAHAASLKQQLKAAQAAQKATKAARKAVEQFAEKLRQQSDAFSKQFLNPLNDLVGAFNDALLASRGPSIRFSADYRVDRSRLDMGLQYRDPVAELEESNDLAPQVVLSEGQLAANGLSILCASSTAYRWSLWRALLLDDPLQHNDVIHLAAFVDLMRNLVEKERYQVIMSSHDWAEADYISRKFDAANLPCTLVRLTAPSKLGVLYEQPQHNAAALAALRSAA